MVLVMKGVNRGIPVPIVMKPALTASTQPVNKTLATVSMVVMMVTMATNVTFPAVSVNHRDVTGRRVTVWMVAKMVTMETNVIGCVEVVRAQHVTKLQAIV